MEKKLLLVDDEEGIRKVLGISLSDMGYEVLTAQNGEEALAVFRAQNPPIVLTDIKMPGIDGISLLQKIKSENPETEVIMITGHGDMELAIQSLKLEATDFVTKPIQDEILEIALKRACERIVMRRQLKSYTENLETMVREKSARLVELERLTAIDQAMEGLSSAMRGIADDLGEDRLRCFNEMPCFVSVHDRSLTVLAVNHLYHKRLGNAVGAPSWKIYKGESAFAERCPVGRTFMTGSGQQSRETVELPDGSQSMLMVHTAPIRNSDGRLDLVLEISADISEVKRLQDELDTTQQRYQQLFDESPCYVTVQDRDLRILASNKRFREDFGDELYARCFQTYKNRYEPCCDCPLLKTFEDGLPHQAEMVATSNSGEQIHLLVGTAALRDVSGEIVQVMELATNITQIRKLQDHLSSLGLLLSSMSHAVKGMLTALDSGIYMIQSGLDKSDPERVQEGVATARRMTERIRDAVLDILYYAKEREMKREVISVMSLIYDVIQIIEPKLKTLPILWNCNVGCVLGEFEVDRTALRSAMVNILENAVEACLEDSRKPSHHVGFGVRIEDGHVVFEISDDGVGMDTEMQERLFALFFSSKGQKGTGLGLFIARKVIQRHQGTISVNSQPGVGTTFSIHIPMKR